MPCPLGSFAWVKGCSRGVAERAAQLVSKGGRRARARGRGPRLRGPGDGAGGVARGGGLGAPRGLVGRSPLAFLLAEQQGADLGVGPDGLVVGVLQGRGAA